MYRSTDFAIADTCFLIDWVRFRRRDLIFKLFKTVFIPESVLREIKSESTVMWVALNLASGNLALYTEVFDEVEEARKITELSRRLPGAISVDLPEALCMAVGRRRGYVVLTENRGAIMFADLVSDYNDVIVWRSLEVLLALHMRRLIDADCNNLSMLFREYEEDTKHIFPERDLSNGVEVLRRELCSKN